MDLQRLHTTESRGEKKKKKKIETHTRPGRKHNHPLSFSTQEAFLFIPFQ
jgi:hypothetical protein